ncbi:hypothetical protein Q8A73_011486 [Channa argus]|nr:hypothetical protein Q8A73_011486 [Channa argus]
MDVRSQETPQHLGHVGAETALFSSCEGKERGHLPFLKALIMGGQSSTSEAGFLPRGSVIHSATVRTRGSFFIEVTSFYNGARHSHRPQKRQIPHFTTPQMSVAEQNRPSMPSPPLQMFILDHAQHRKPSKRESISRHCGNQGGRSSTESLWRGTLPEQ